MISLHPSRLAPNTCPGSPWSEQGLRGGRTSKTQSRDPMVSADQWRRLGLADIFNIDGVEFPGLAPRRRSPSSACSGTAPDRDRS